MIIDLNAHLGHYPFARQVSCDSKGLVALMNRNGIDQAVVTSLNSVFYRHAHAGNEELMHEVRQAPERLVPLTTIDPTYAGWEHDLDLAIAEWKTKGIYLVPGYHPYRLNDAKGRRVLERAVARGLPVAIPERLEDRRRRHWMDTTEDLPFEDIIEAARSFPELKLILLNWGRFDWKKARDAGLAGRVLVDFTRMAVVAHRDVPAMIEQLGIGAVAFGTDLPMSSPGPALVKLALLDFISKDDLERIMWRNTAEFLNIRVSK